MNKANLKKNRKGNNIVGKIAMFIFVAVILMSFAQEAESKKEKEVKEPYRPEQSTTAVSKEPTIAEYGSMLKTIVGNPTAVKSELKKLAKEKWTKDGTTKWSMVEYEYDLQCEAFGEVSALVNRSDFKGTVNEEILINAANKWGFKFSMVMYEYELQMEAYNNFNN